MMTTKWDLALDNRGKVKAWNTGFFERNADLSMAEMPELIEFGEYRFKKNEYETHKELFTKAILNTRKTSAIKIRHLRERTGLSQTAFGKKYGIPMRTIQNWENGVTEAPEYVISLLERAVVEDTRKPVALKDRRMGELLDGTGYVEIWTRDLWNSDRDQHYHVEDFAEGGQMERFAGYTVDRFEADFGCSIWLG